MKRKEAEWNKSGREAAANSDDGIRNEVQLYRDARQARLSKRKKRRRNIVALTVVLFLLIFLYFNWKSFAPTEVANTVQSFLGGMGTGQFPLTLPSGTFKDAAPIGSNLGVLTDTSLILYSKSGGQIDVRAHGMNDPHIVSAGGKAVLYDRGGKQFRVETRFSEPYKGTADYAIISAAVGKSGNIAVVTESEQYLSELTVYDPKYKSVFKWSSTQGRVISAALSPDGKNLAAITVGAKNGDITSSVYLFSLGKQEPLAVAQYDGTLLFSVQYADSSHITAVGDTKSVFLSASTGKGSEYSYNGKTLKCYANNDGTAVLALETGSNSGSSRLLSFAGGGKITGQTDVTGEIHSVFEHSGRIVALTTSQIWYADNAMKNQGTFAVAGDETGALPLKDSAYLFGTQTVYLDKYQGKNSSGSKTASGFAPASGASTSSSKTAPGASKS